MKNSEILNRAWELVRKNKLLWLFAFVANLGNNVETDEIMDLLPDDFKLRLANALQIVLSGSGLYITFALLALFSLAMMLVNAFGESALIHQTPLAQKYQLLTMESGIQAGKKYIWKILGLTVIFTFPMIIFGFGTLFIVIQSLAGMLNQVSTGFLSDGVEFVSWFMPSLCVLTLIYVPITWAVGMMQRACVLEDISIKASIGKGWKLTFSNFGRIFMFVLGQMLSLFLAGIVAIIPVLLLMVPLFLVWGLDVSGPIRTVVLASEITVMVILGAGVNSLVTAYRSVGWTLLYDELSQEMARVPQVTPSWLEE